MLKALLKHTLKNIGLQKIPTEPSLLSLEAALERIGVKNIEIETVIDVGASNGCWSKVCQNYFPNAYYYLIEANTFHQKSLEQFKTSSTNVDFVVAAAGDKIGEIYFDASDPFGGLASHTFSQKDDIKVPVVTVDSICKSHNLQPPFLIKLDTHGFEVPIFEGASKALDNASVIIVEVYNFNITDKSLRFHQMCQYLEDRGFRCIDMCDPTFRKDSALWQLDLFFIRASHPIFYCNSWK